MGTLFVVSIALVVIFSIIVFAIVKSLNSLKQLLTPRFITFVISYSITFFIAYTHPSSAIAGIFFGLTGLAVIVVIGYTALAALVHNRWWWKPHEGYIMVGGKAIKESEFNESRGDHRVATPSPLYNQEDNQ